MYAEMQPGIYVGYGTSSCLCDEYRWEFRIVPCLAGGNASATCLKMLVMRFSNVQ